MTNEQNIIGEFMVLDWLLTGHDVRTTWRTAQANMRRFDWVDFIEGNAIYYLSDGGYSRVIWNYMMNTVALTSNSRTEIKTKWDEPVVVNQRGIIREWLTRFRHELQNS